MRRQWLLRRQAPTSALPEGPRVSSALLLWWAKHRLRSIPIAVLRHPVCWRLSTRNGASAAPCAWMPVLPMRFWVRTNACTPWLQSTAPAAGCAFPFVRLTALRWSMPVARARDGMPGRLNRQAMPLPATPDTATGCFLPCHFQCPQGRPIPRTRKTRWLRPWRVHESSDRFEVKPVCTLLQTCVAPCPVHLQ